MLSKKINRKKGVGVGVCHHRCSCCIAAATPTPTIICPSFAHPHSQPILIHVHSHAHHGCCRTHLPLGPHSTLSVCPRPHLSTPASFVCAHHHPHSSVHPIVVYMCPHQPSCIRACACTCLYVLVFMLARMQPSFVLAGPCFSCSFVPTRLYSFACLC